MNSTWTFVFQLLLVVVCSLIGVYFISVIARVVFGAYFDEKRKHLHELMNFGGEENDDNKTDNE